MKRVLLTLTACSALLASSGALAQEPASADAVATPAPAPTAASAPAAEGNATGSATAGGSATDKKFVLGLRLGYGLPMGSISKDVKFSDFFSSMIPIWLDVGYMVTPNVMLGVYGQYGLVSIKNCPSGASCSAHDIRVGVQGQYHVLPSEKIDPWFGLGIGYESLAGSVAGVSGSDTGFEFANLQAGLDFKLSPAFGFGPFASFSLGQFSNETTAGQSASIPEKALHEWFTLGVRGAFNL